MSVQPNPAPKIGKPLVLAKPQPVRAALGKPPTTSPAVAKLKAEKKQKPVRMQEKQVAGKWQPIGFQNAWILAEDKAKVRVPAWLALIVTALVVGGAVSQWTVVYDFIIAHGYVGPLSMIGDRALSFALIFSPLILAFGALTLLGRRPRPRGGLAVFPSLVFGMMIGATGCALGVGSAWALGGAVLENVPPYSQTLAIGLAAGFGLLLFQVLSEELFFRGWLLPIVAAQWGPSIGLVTSSLIFSALHQIGQEFLPVQFVNQALGGLLFGLLALRCGSIWAPIAAHLSWNYAYFHVLGLAPNPGADPLGVVFDFDTVGNALIFGGEHEMVAGVHIGIVLTILCVFLMLVRPKKEIDARKTSS